MKNDMPFPDLKPMKILYAEDCESNVMLFQLYLKQTPFTLEVAENGKEAVDKFVRERDFDVVLMDIQMPVLDGYGATKAIRAHEKEKGLDPTPVIAVTAHAFQENEELAYQAGCDAFITKPVRKALLIETIQDWGEKKYGS